MNKTKVETQIGNRKWIFEADLANEHDRKFADEIQEVAATNPANLQEFLIRIAELQRSKQQKKIG